MCFCLCLCVGNLHFAIRHKFLFFAYLSLSFSLSLFSLFALYTAQLCVCTIWTHSNVCNVHTPFEINCTKNVRYSANLPFFIIFILTFNMRTYVWSFLSHNRATHCSNVKLQRQKMFSLVNASAASQVNFMIAFANIPCKPIKMVCKLHFTIYEYHFRWYMNACQCKSARPWFQHQFQIE